MTSHRGLIKTIDGYIDSEIDDETVLDAYERITDGFLAVDDDRRLTYLNRMGAELLGRDRSEVLGDSLRSLFPAGDDSVFYERICEAMTQQSPISFDGYYTSAGAWFRVNAYPSEDGVSVYFRDVTEEKERRSELERYEAFVQESSDAITLLDEDGTILYNSPSVERILGHRQHERIGESAFRYVHPEDRRRVFEEFQKLTEMDEETVRDVEFRLETGDGSYTWVEGVGKNTNSTEVGGFVVNVRDISDRKEWERELERRNGCLERINKASERLIASESHEEIGKVLADTGTDLFDDAEFYIWDDDEGALLAEGKRVTKADDSPAWRAFVDGGTVITRPNNGVDSEGTVSFGEFTGEPARLDTLVGDIGVLSLHTSEFTELTDRLIGSLVSVASIASERVEKEGRITEISRELHDKNEKLRRVSEIDEVMRELIKKVIEADSRESIEKAVCEQILEVDGWEFVWFVKKNDDGTVASCLCGDDELGGILGDFPEGAPSLRSVDDGEMRVLNDVTKAEISDWRRAVLNQGYLSAAAIPVRYGTRSFGVVEVYSTDSDAFDDPYTDALVDAAKVAGYAFTSAEQVSSILSGGDKILTLGIDGGRTDCFFANVADRLRTDVHVTAVVPRHEGANFYFDTAADFHELRRIADTMPVELSETMNGYVVNASEMAVFDCVREFGGRVSRYSADGGRLHIELHLPQSVAARSLVDAVSKEYSGVELVSQNTETPDGMRVSDTCVSPLDELTERQKTVLRLAYENGFFETPREKTGQELADEIGITATTFHQHIRAAEKRIFDCIYRRMP